MVLIAYESMTNERDENFKIISLVAGDYQKILDSLINIYLTLGYEKLLYLLVGNSILIVLLENLAQTARKWKI